MSSAASPPEAVPVIAIDGPSASGKGTVASGVARALGFHYLDSGALYRLASLAALRSHAGLDDEAALAAATARMQVDFRPGSVWLDGEDVTEALRCDLKLELAAHPQLKTAIADCESCGDYVSRDLFRQIMASEEEHIDWLETQLELIDKVGVANYQQSQMSEGN